MTIPKLEWPEPTARSSMHGGEPCDYVADLLCGGYCLRVHKAERWSGHVTWSIWDANAGLCAGDEAPTITEGQAAAEAAVLPLLSEAVALLERGRA